MRRRQKIERNQNRTKLFEMIRQRGFDHIKRDELDLVAAPKATEAQTFLERARRSFEIDDAPDRDLKKAV